MPAAALTKTPPPLLIESEAPVFKERTSAWFADGDAIDEEGRAAAAAIEAERSTLAMRQAKLPLWRRPAVAAAAAAGVGLLLLVVACC